MNRFISIKFRLFLAFFVLTSASVASRPEQDVFINDLHQQITQITAFVMGLANNELQDIEADLYSNLQRLHGHFLRKFNELAHGDLEVYRGSPGLQAAGLAWRNCRAAIISRLVGDDIPPRHLRLFRQDAGNSVTFEVMDPR